MGYLGRLLGRIAILNVVVGMLVAFLPVRWLLPPSMRLREEFKPAVSPDLSNAPLLQYDGDLPGPFLGALPRIRVGPKGFLLVISPGSNLSGTVNGTDATLRWHYDNLDWFKAVTNRFGGVLFRGFNINTPRDFDDLIAGLHPDIVSDIYLGTTPRLRVNGTRYIQTATEAPYFVSIPTHIELSFSKMPPKRLYFYSNLTNPPPGGYTPLTDFAQVWDDLSPAFKEKMLSRGLLYERWYNNVKNRNLDPLVHKTWQAMFLTENRTRIREMATEQGYDPSWDERDDLLLSHEAVITRTHSDTGRVFWCTHFNVLHAATFAIPFAWDAQIFESKFSAFITLLFHSVISLRKVLGYHYGANVLYADDRSELAWSEAMHIRETISKNTWMFPYEKGDVLMIDNHRLAHGRTPWYKGERSVMVAYK